MASRFRHALLAGLIAGAVMGVVPAEERGVSIDRLSEQLKASELPVRREAALQLQKLGAASKPALAGLITAMGDEDKQVWSAAIGAIAAMGPEAQEAIPALISGLDSRVQRGKRQRDTRQLAMRSAFALSRMGKVAIPALTEALKQEDAGLRAGAARALGAMGPDAHEAIPVLVEYLSEARDPVREEVIAALGLLGTEAGPVLVPALAAPDARRRAGAAAALAQMTPPYREAGPAVEKAIEGEQDEAACAALIEALPKVGVEPSRCLTILIPKVTGESDTTRHAALNALLTNRALRVPAVTKLAELVRDPDPKKKERAARALGRFGEDAGPALPVLLEAARASGGAPAFADTLSQVGPVVLPALLKTLQEAKPEESAWILRSLRGFGAPAVPVLTEALKHEQPTIRAAAAGALGSMGRDAATAIAPLFVLAEDANVEVQAAALRALVAQRADSAWLKPLLGKALDSEDGGVRRAGATGLAAYGGAAQLGLRALLDLLADEDASSRLAAVTALGDLGPKAAPAVDRLAARLDDPKLQTMIMETLGKIGPAAAPAVPRLAEMAKSTDQRATVLLALTKIGPGATAALPLVYNSLADPAGDVRATAAVALSIIEPDQEKALGALIPLAGDASGRMRRAVSLALVKYGPAARPAAPALVKMLANEPERNEALRTLKVVGIDTIPDLRKMLEIKDPKVRALACESLGAMGPAAEEVVPQLRALLNQDGSVRQQVKDALAKIEGDPPKAP